MLYGFYNKDKSKHYTTLLKSIERVVISDPNTTTERFYVKIKNCRFIPVTKETYTELLEVWENNE